MHSYYCASDSESLALCVLGFPENTAMGIVVATYFLILSLVHAVFASALQRIHCNLHGVHNFPCSLFVYANLSGAKLQKH